MCLHAYPEIYTYKKKWFDTMFQHLVLFIYQVVMGLVSRNCKFRADKYSCQLGYGPQLSYFLLRFVEGQEIRQKSLNEILNDMLTEEHTSMI